MLKKLFVNNFAKMRQSASEATPCESQANQASAAECAAGAKWAYRFLRQECTGNAKAGAPPTQRRPLRPAKITRSADEMLSAVLRLHQLFAIAFASSACNCVRSFEETVSLPQLLSR